MPVISVERKYGPPTKVDAVLVGGVDGVFAVWSEKGKPGVTSSSGTTVHFAAGDDGHWWEIASYDSAWIDEIAGAVGRFVNRKKRK